MPLRLSVKPEELPSAYIFLNDINTEEAASDPSPSCCSTTQRLNSICPGFEHFAHHNVNYAQQESNNDLNSLLQMSRADGFTASCSSRSSSFSSSNSENSSSSPKRCYPLMLMKTYKTYKTIHTHRCSDYCFQSTMTAVNHRCNGSNLDTEQVECKSPKKPQCEKKHYTKKSNQGKQKNKKKCYNCFTTHSPTWRRGTAKETKNQLLCNACGL
jgi:hypothetical protein